MNNKEVAQAFAQGKTKGKGHNLYIEGNTVYSYGKHFPIATRIGSMKVLFNMNRYSVSTSRHQSYVKAALLNSGYVIVMTEHKDPTTGQLLYPEK